MLMKTSKSSTRRGTRPKSKKGMSQKTRRGSAGSRILAAIEEATEILRSEGLSSPHLTVRTYQPAPAPPVYKSDDVKRVRALLGASQAVLANFLGVNVNTIRSWEQGKRLPQPIASRFLSEIEADPGYWRGRISKSLDHA